MSERFPTTEAAGLGARMPAPTSAIVLGGTGYVAGELLRLIAGHPHLELAAILSESQPGAPVGAAFPHLHAAYPQLAFASLAEVETLIGRTPRTALFSAAPHGAAAGLIDRLLRAGELAGVRVHCVDISADYRYRSAAAYEAVYGQAHAAPARLADFTCAVPEHLAAASTRHIAHPGCFATAILLASVPLLAAGVTDGRLFVSGVTGSTGSGRKPSEGTHHPQRHGDLYSYNALAHRHVPEIVACAKLAAGVDAEVNFVPHSGPFARGIHVTVQAGLVKPLDGPGARALMAAYYQASPFVRIVAGAPRIKDVVASNFAHLGAASNGRTIAITAAIDNLDKGAAGGAVQWMNRLLGYGETTGLTAPAPGWT